MDRLRLLIGERLDQLLDSAPDPTTVIDPDGILRFVNERGVVEFGHSRAQLVGHHIRDLVPGWDLAELSTLSASGATPSGVVRHRNGHAIPVEVSVVTLEGGEGHHIVYLRDISARIRLEQEADRMRDELIANISHELRTPLTSIIGYLELLEDLGDEELGPQVRRVLDVVARNANRELRLVNDLLAVTFVDEDRARMRLTPVDLGSVAGQVVEERQLFAHGAGLEISLHVEGAVTVLGDADRLVRLIENLVINSFKFSPPGGQVRVVVAAEGPNGVLAVSDTGIGISPQEQAHIFDRLYRAPGVVEGHIEGAGLGLSIAKSIVEAHSGTISVDSVLGQGTTVRVALPLSDQRVGLGRLVAG